MKVSHFKSLYKKRARIKIDEVVNIMLGLGESINKSIIIQKILR